MNTKTKHWASVTAGILSLAGYACAGNTGSEKYTYDASGNIVQKQIDDQVTRFAYAGNELRTNTQGVTYLHDAAGRLTGESQDGRVERKLSYQFGDKVTEVVKGGITTEFLYNAEGQLVGRNAGGQAEAFAWDGLGLVMRGEQAYANEDHVVGGVPVLTNDEVTVSDQLGSTLNVGETSFESTAFGEGLEGGIFTGKPFIEGLDGFVFKHRSYSPEQGRWAIPDISGFPDGSNNFAYALGDPISNCDPLGLWTLVGTVSPEKPVDTVSNTSESWSATSAGRIYGWCKVTETTTTTPVFAPKPVASGAPGDGVSVGCSLVGSSPGAWSVGVSYIASVSYTFGSSGTPTASGSVHSPPLSSTANKWEGSGGLARRKKSWEEYSQVRVNVGGGVYEPIDDPELTGETGVQASDWLSGTVVGEFKEYEP